VITELTELGATSQGAQEELAEDLLEQQSIRAALEQLIQQYQRLQERLEALQLNHQDLLAQDARHCGLSEQYRSFFETRHHLKLENLRLAGKVRTQEPQLEALQQAKTRLESELERLKGIEEAHQLSQRKATQLKEQLQRAHEEVEQRKGEISALSVEYLSLFERQSS
jgi:uncharacterized protein (DUF3084 family)